MITIHPHLTDAQRHALGVLAAGTAEPAVDTRLTPTRTVNPLAAKSLERLGLAERSELDGRWQLTDDGRQFAGRLDDARGRHPSRLEPDTGRRWTLHLPDLAYVSPNKRLHWSKRSGRNRAWREQACWIAKQLRIPRLERIRVELVYWPPDRRRRDPDNLVSGVLKPVVDGLVDARVVPDDTAEYVDRAMPEIREPRNDRKPTWHLIVTDLGESR